MKCKECGKEIRFSYGEYRNEELKTEKLCFDCDFWVGYIKRDKTKKDALVINGWHYIVGDEDEPGKKDWRGCGGSKFTIKAFDGREITTTNLWVQGEVPNRFRSRMPDNAVFIGNKFR